MTHTKYDRACYSTFLTTLGIIKYFSVLANMRYICLYIHVRIDMFYMFMHIDVFIYLFTTQQALVLWLSHSIVLLQLLCVVTCCNSLSCRLLSPWDFSNRDTGMGYHFLLQGTFPTQGSNLGLLHFRQTLYCLSHQGSPCI